MAKSQNTERNRQYLNDLDSALTDVMPDTWAGHLRAAILASDEDLSAEQLETALEVAEQKHEKYLDFPTETVAERIIEATCRNVD